MENQNKQETKSHSLTSEFVSYEQALELKQLGFDEECLKYYTDKGELYVSNIYGISAPLYQQAFRFFREEYGIDSWVYCSTENGGYWVSILKDKRFVMTNINKPTYEEAEHACLLKLIELAKQK